GELLVARPGLAEVGRKQARVDRVDHRRISFAICMSWSCVWIALESIWKLRCASMTFTIALARSTFEASRKPWRMPCVATGRIAPLCAVGGKSEPPTGSRLDGEGTLMTWIW